MKRKRFVKVNARKVQESDIALGERIRARRNQIVMSQEELGKALGVSLQQIQKYETGKDRIASSRLFLLAAALGVPVSFFFAGLPKVARSKASSTTLMQRRRNGRH